MIISERRADNRVFTQSVGVLSGSFDPLHPGHIEFMQAAKRHADIVVVGIHTDEWLDHKKGSSFQPFYDRLRLVEAVKYVDVAMGFDDDDQSLLETVERMFPDKKITHLSGGSKHLSVTLAQWCSSRGIGVKTAVGGASKWDTSETLLANWTAFRKKVPF